MQKNLKWTETCFSSCYFSYILFQARLTNEISTSLGIYTTLPSALRRKALRRPLGRRGVGECRGGRRLQLVLFYAMSKYSDIAVESYIAIVIRIGLLLVSNAGFIFLERLLWESLSVAIGEGIVSTKPRPKSVYDFLGSVHCFIVLSCVFLVIRPYVIYVILLSMARYSLYLCWKCS